MEIEGEKRGEQFCCKQLLWQIIANMITESTDLLNLVFLLDSPHSLAALGLAKALITSFHGCNSALSILPTTQASLYFYRALATLCLVFLPVALFLTFSGTFLTAILQQD